MTFIFCMFNQDEHLNCSAYRIQSFVIWEELYHLQGLLQHSFICVLSFTQIYLYNSQAAIEYQFMNADESLHKHILLQFAETLYECNNLFINIYHSVKEVLDQHQQGSVQLMISSQMHLIMKAESNECHTNLLTANEMMVILPNEYDQACFCDIVICSHHTEGAQQGFSHVHFSHATYIPLQYPLLFSYSDPGWTWTLWLHRQDEQISRVNMSQQMYYHYHLFRCSNQVTVLSYVQKLA